MKRAWMVVGATLVGCGLTPVELSLRDAVVGGDILLDGVEMAAVGRFMRARERAAKPEDPALFSPLDGSVLPAGFAPLNARWGVAAAAKKSPTNATAEAPLCELLLVGEGASLRVYSTAKAFDVTAAVLQKLLGGVGSELALGLRCATTPALVEVARAKEARVHVGPALSLATFYAATEHGVAAAVPAADPPVTMTVVEPAGAEFAVARDAPHLIFQRADGGLFTLNPQSTAPPSVLREAATTAPATAPASDGPPATAPMTMPLPTALPTPPSAGTTGPTAHSFALSPDGAWLAYTHAASIDLLDAHSGAGLATAQLAEGTQLSEPSFSPDGTRLAVTVLEAPPIPAKDVPGSAIGLLQVAADGVMTDLSVLVRPEKKDESLIQPAFTADGAGILFVRVKGKVSDLAQGRVALYDFSAALARDIAMDAALPKEVSDLWPVSVASEDADTTYVLVSSTRSTGPEKANDMRRTHWLLPLRPAGEVVVPLWISLFSDAPSVGRTLLGP